MRYVRPFDRSALGPSARETLVLAGEELGCTIDLRRGGGHEPCLAVPEETFVLVLAGRVLLAAGPKTDSAEAGDMIFLPSNSAGWLSAGPDAVWIEIRAQAESDVAAQAEPAVIRVDQSKFEGGGFAYQSLVDRSQGAATMRINVLQVEPGAGSPDFHIHAFAQLYVIQEGQMTLDVGQQRLVAPADSIVVLPAGVVHRNYNASTQVERHISLLVPEPERDAIFDFAVTIHEREAELLGRIPD